MKTLPIFVLLSALTFTGCDEPHPQPSNKVVVQETKLISDMTYSDSGLVYYKSDDGFSTVFHPFQDIYDRSFSLPVPKIGDKFNAVWEKKKSD